VDAHIGKNVTQKMSSIVAVIEARDLGIQLLCSELVGDSGVMELKRHTYLLSFTKAQQSESNSCHTGMREESDGLIGAAEI
jgi:hypothetical protein